MNFSKTSISLSGSSNGILKGCYYFSLGNILHTNRKMHFYKFSINDVVEVHFGPDTIVVFKFPHTPETKLNNFMNDDKIGFYSDYFKAAGLEGKRFLFDLEYKNPVRYSDFSYSHNKPLVSDHNAFIFDTEKDGYITTLESVLVFDSVEKIAAIDNSLLALSNNICNMSKPKLGMTMNGIISMSIVSAMMSNIDQEEIRFDIHDMDLNSKYYKTFKDIEFPFSYVENTIKMLKMNKLRELVNSTELNNRDRGLVEFDISSISLTELMEVGLDTVIKGVKNPSKKINIDIDTSFAEIKKMEIWNGVAFITPTGLHSDNWYSQMFDSDNIQLTLKGD